MSLQTLWSSTEKALPTIKMTTKDGEHCMILVSKGLKDFQRTEPIFKNIPLWERTVKEHAMLKKGGLVGKSWTRLHTLMFWLIIQSLSIFLSPYMTVVSLPGPITIHQPRGHTFQQNKVHNLLKVKLISNISTKYFKFNHKKAFMI